MEYRFAPQLHPRRDTRRTSLPLSDSSGHRPFLRFRCSAALYRDFDSRVGLDNAEAAMLALCCQRRAAVPDCPRALCFFV